MRKHKLIIFKNGAAILETRSRLKIDIDGDEPIKEDVANRDNIKKHFKDHKKVIKSMEETPFKPRKGRKSNN